jgi:hypothetical protein
MLSSVFIIAAGIAGSASAQTKLTSRFADGADAFFYHLTPGVMGPGVRRDDAERAVLTSSFVGIDGAAPIRCTQIEAAALA